MHHKRALIVGRARGVWQEVEHALKLCRFHLIICINQAGIDYPGAFDHWVSYHGSKFPDWVKARRKKFPQHLVTMTFWTSASGRKVRDKERHLGLNMIPCWEGGSSGRIAYKVARVYRADRIVLTGVPLQAEFGHYDQEGDWAEAHLHRKAWLEMSDIEKGMIRSMSGWTKEQFQEPTREWLTM